MLSRRVLHDSSVTSVVGISNASSASNASQGRGGRPLSAHLCALCVEALPEALPTALLAPPDPGVVQMPLAQRRRIGLELRVVP